MNQIGSMFLVGMMGILGGIPTLYILISLPVILVQKIFGKIKYGKYLYQQRISTGRLTEEGSIFVI